MKIDITNEVLIIENSIKNMPHKIILHKYFQNYEGNNQIKKKKINLAL